MAEPSGGPFLGREVALASLRAALTRAAAGHPSAVVVSGELGVGKTRLVREFLAHADAVAFAGGCVPVVGEPLPYAALTQALRRNRSGVVAQELARSPELARLLPDAPDAAGGTDPATALGSRLRLFQAVLGLLGRLSAHRPVVHVVEDVQWADRSTLDLLAFLATNLVDERVLVVLTHRTDAVGDDRLVPWLAELGRLWHVERLPLERLDEADTAALVTQLRGEQPEAGLLADVVARSAGNPLFVEQLALTAREGSPLPANLHDLLHSRLASLPDDTRGVLGAAAVIGRRASLSLLTRTTGLAAEELDAALRPAVVAHVVEVDDDLRVDFHHPAFREVLEAGLMPGERTRLHLAAADALAADLERFPGVIGEMARHWHAVGELERALAAWVRAGEAYTRMDAFSDAWAAYRNVLELVQQVPHDLDVVGLTLLAAEAADLADEADAALPLLERVRAAATTDTVRATAAARTGWILFRRGGGDAAHRAFQDALALLPPDETSVLAARIQAGLALLAAGWSRLDEAEEAAAEALRIARAIGARREIGLALNAQGCVAALRGRLDEGVPLLREALTIAREGQDPQDLGAAYVNLSHVLGMAGLLGDAVELARVGIGELTRVGQERQQGSLLLHNVSEQLVEAGRYAEARELVDEALARHPRGIQAAPVLRTAARIAMTSGDLTTAWERCEQARLVVEVESAPVAWLREVLETAAEVELWAGRPDAAYDVVLDGLELVAGTDDEAFATALVALGLRALADSAAVHRDHRARTLRESQRRRLLAALESMRHHPGAGGQPDDAALALWVQAELARLDAPRDVTATAEAWAGSADAWAGLGRPFRSAYARWREAEARLAGGVNADSLGALRGAHAAAVALDASRLVEECGSLATWYRVDLLPAVVERPEGDPLAAYHLTEREREVLLALAAGHSNREIAQEMFISVKTASVHVSNILRKLDVKGRQDAARIAHRLGVGS